MSIESWGFRCVEFCSHFYSLFRNNVADSQMKLFAKDISTLGSNTFTRSSLLNVPLQFTSDLQPEPFDINPGDIILGDADGIVAIPPTLVEQCLKLCEERWDIDEKTRACLEKGDEMGPTIQKLRK
jgi:regulator of RNase E activity RraA